MSTLVHTRNTPPDSTVIIESEECVAMSKDKVSEDPVILSAKFIKNITHCTKLEDIETLEMCIDSKKLRPDNLGQLVPNLKYLKLSNSILPKIRDIGLSFASLEVLWMSRCCLHSIDGLGEFRSLREIYLAFNEISDISPCGLLSNLEILDLEGNKISDKESLVTLDTCLHLSNLTLQCNPVVKQFESYSKYWTYVKELLPRLTCLDGIPTQVTPNSNTHNYLLNGFNFDEEWDYINHVIDELSIAPFKTKCGNTAGRGSTTRRSSENYSSKLNQLSKQKLMSSINLSPDEKRKRSAIGDDGIIRDVKAISLDTVDCPRWADSHPSIKSTKLDLNCGSVICGDIANALRQRRNSASIPVLQTTPNIVDCVGNPQDPHGQREQANIINENEICEQEVRVVDGESDLVIIEELQSDCKKVLDDLDEWRGSYMRKSNPAAPRGANNSHETSMNGLKCVNKRNKQASQTLSNTRHSIHITTDSNQLQPRKCKSSKTKVSILTLDSKSQNTRYEIGGYKAALRPSLLEGTGQSTCGISTEVGNVPTPKRKSVPNNSRKLLC